MISVSWASRTSWSASMSLFESPLCGDFITSCSMFSWDSSKAWLNSLCIKVFDGHYSLFFFYPISLNSDCPFPSLHLLPPPLITPSIHPFFPAMALLSSLALYSPTSPQVTSSRAAQQQQSQTGAGSGKNSPLLLFPTLLCLSSWRCIFFIIN